MTTRTGSWLQTLHPLGLTQCQALGARSPRSLERGGKEPEMDWPRCPGAVPSESESQAPQDRTA